MTPFSRASLHFVFTLLPALAAATGCASTEPKKLTPTATKDFALTLFTAEPKALKFTWFEVTRDGQLLYAGGAEASQRQGKPVATLSPQQRQEIWDILLRGKIDDAPVGPLFPKGTDVTYDFTLNTGGFDRIVRAADGEQPALRELHSYLYDIQKQQYAR